MFVPVLTAEPMEVLNHRFEYYNGEIVTTKTMGVAPDDWEYADGSGNGIEAGTSTVDGEPFCVVLAGVDSIYQLVDHTIAPGDEYTLTFDARYWWSSGAWEATYECRLYYDDNGSREIIDSVGESSPDDFAAQTWLLDKTLNTTIPPGSPAIGRQLGIELAVTAQASDSWFAFDNIRLDGILQTGAAVNPDPYVGEEEVELSRVFTWQIGEDPNDPGNPMPGVIGYFVYLGTDETAVAVAGTDDLSGIYRDFKAVGDESYNPSASSEPLVNDETYYWRVDEKLAGDANTIGGKIWMFYSERTLPDVAEQPKDAYAFPGDTAVLTTAGAPSPTPLFYQWYRGESPDRTNPVDGGDTAELSIPDVSVDDEGLYYCRITNDAGDIDTESALLMVKRLMGHWKLDGNLDDATANGHNGIGDPNFVDGKDGSAVELFGDGEIIEIADSAESFNFYPNGYSVSAWVKNSMSGWGGIVAKQDRGDTWKGWVLNCNGTNGTSTLRQTPASDYAGTSDITDDQWHLVVSEYDAVVGRVRIYVDGLLENESPELTSTIETNTFPVIIGAETSGGFSPFTGLVDDVRIWNYPVDPVDVALLYTDFNPGEEVCVDNVGLAYDLDGNCTVDLGDVAVFAATWANCRSVPDCLPER